MPNFTVVYVKGRAVGTGSYATFEPLSGKTLYNVETASRINAYIKTSQHLAKLGMSIFVAMDQSANGDSPLGFTEREIQAIESQGVAITTDITDGVRIEKIVREN
jgi:hypothetical protein